MIPAPTAMLFLDTAYAIALSARTDAHHTQAVALADRIEEAKTRLLTTRAVLVEIGNALSKPRYRSAAVALLDALEQDPRIEIAPLTEDLYARALDLFRARPDKKRALTDCISFVVMRELGVSDALTTDEDFEQAAFAPGSEYAEQVDNTGGGGSRCRE